MTVIWRDGLQAGDAVKLAQTAAADGVYRVAAVLTPGRFKAKRADGEPIALRAAPTAGGGGGTATRFKVIPTSVVVSLRRDRLSFLSVEGVVAGS